MRTLPVTQSTFNLSSLPWLSSHYDYHCRGGQGIIVTWKMARKRGWTGHFLRKKSGKDILVSGTRVCKGRWHGQESVSVWLQSQLPVSGDRMQGTCPGL